MMDHIGDGSFEGILYGLEDVRIGRMYKPRFMIRHPHPYPYPHPYPMPVHLGPCTAYTMSFIPQIPVHQHGGNYHVAPMQPQPCYFMLLPHVMIPAPLTLLFTSLFSRPSPSLFFSSLSRNDKKQKQFAKALPENFPEAATKPLSLSLCKI
ncbi:hypothetical protein Q3G72_025115 [Acer saccharum]|nr:hypothetical protein Q3G72_025115 [Acer saccharum]